MYRQIGDFVADYDEESASTLAVIEALVDECLELDAAPGDATIGGLVWHISSFAPYRLLNPLGLGIEEAVRPSGTTVAELSELFSRVRRGIIERAPLAWHDTELAGQREVFGMVLPLGKWLGIVVKHEVHHRGQLSVLLSRAGLAVPALYGA